MKDAPERRWRLADSAWVLAAALVVAVFFAATIATGLYARAIEGHAIALEASALPSIDRLAAARGELRSMGLAVRDLARGHSRARNAPDAARKRLLEGFDAYLALPAFAGEKELQQNAVADLAAYQRAVDAVLARVDAGDGPKARALLDAELQPAGDRVDQDLEGLVQLNAREAGRSSKEIQQDRESATRSAARRSSICSPLASPTTW